MTRPLSGGGTVFQRSRESHGPNGRGPGRYHAAPVAASGRKHHAAIDAIPGHINGTGGIAWCAAFYSPSFTRSLKALRIFATFGAATALQER